jgi:hypothetical protein
MYNTEGYWAVSATSPLAATKIPRHDYCHNGSQSANSDLNHDATELVLGLRLLYS